MLLDLVFSSSFLTGVVLSLIAFLSGAMKIHLPAKMHLPVKMHLPTKMHLPVKGALHGHVAVGDLSPYNFAALSAFLAWFGGAGYLLHQKPVLATFVVLTIAVAVGVGGATLVNLLLRALIRNETEVAPDAVSGALAIVTSPILEGRTGEVAYQVEGTRRFIAARHFTGDSIPRGEEVLILSTDRGIALVRSWRGLTPP